MLFGIDNVVLASCRSLPQQWYLLFETDARQSELCHRYIRISIQFNNFYTAEILIYSAIFIELCMQI